MIPVRVALVAPSMAIVGGQSVQAVRLLDSLQTYREAEITFVPINPALRKPLRFLQHVRYVRTVVTELAYAFGLLRASRRCDVLHVFTAGYSSFALTFLPAMVIRRLLKVRLILHYHDGRAPDHFRRFPRAPGWARVADRIVVPSGYLVDVFARFGLRAQAIFNTVDTSQFAYRERRTLQPRFLHNRGLEAHYNVACTLRAFALVQREYPAASLALAHDGPLRSQLEALAQELHLRNIMFLGSVSQEHMRRLYQEADIYLMSPDIDNMPLSVLECYASGLPLVSTAAGGVPYMVQSGETGLLVPPNDHQAMAAAAIRLLRDPELGITLARNGLAQCALYAAERSVQQWLHLYRELKEAPQA